MENGDNDNNHNQLLVFEPKDDKRINKCNLELLTNPLYQKVVVNPKKEEENENKNCKTDLKFYRKRILTLTNDYLKGKYSEHGPYNEALKRLHNEYVYNVIQYLKMTDKVDIIQHEHAPEYTPISSTPTPLTSPTCEQYSQTQTPSQTQQLDSYNSHLIVKQVKTLDSYVKKTKRKVKSPVKLPINRVIDYHSPELKNKGVKENNINKI